MVFVWGWWIIKVAQSCTYNGVCSLMCRFPSSVWFTCPRGAAGSLIVCTYFPKKTCLSLSAMLFFLLPCGWTASKCPNLHLQSWEPSKPTTHPVHNRPSGGLSADFQMVRSESGLHQFIAILAWRYLTLLESSRPETKLNQIRIQKHVKEKVLKVSKFKFL